MDCLALIRLILKKCQSSHAAQRIRERLYDICKLYLPRSRSGVVGTTLTEVVEVIVASHFLSPDWRDPQVIFTLFPWLFLQLHSEFSLKIYEWLIDKTIVRDDNLATSGLYSYYSKPGDQDAPQPSEFKVHFYLSCPNLFLRFCWHLSGAHSYFLHALLAGFIWIIIGILIWASFQSISPTS